MRRRECRSGPEELGRCGELAPRATLTPDQRPIAPSLPAQLPTGGVRTPLTLSLSSDGLAWERIYSLRGSDTLPAPRFRTDVGFAYPASMWTGDEFFVVYSINKEDIALTRLKLRDL